MSTEEDNYERGYIEGGRQARVMLLQSVLSDLGYEHPEAQQAAWIMEREQAVAKLREVCAEFGDNGWPGDLALADVIDKHLLPYLQETD